MSESGEVVSGGVDRQLEELAALEAVAVNEDAPEIGDMAGGTGGAQEEKEPEITTGQLMTGLFSLGFGLAAKTRGPHWALSSAEAEETGEAVGALLDKYFPDMGTHGPELVAVLTVGSVVVPRLGMDSQIKEARKQKQAKAMRQNSAHDSKEDAPILDMAEG